MDRILTALDTGRGECYVDLAEVVCIGSAIQNKEYGRSRSLVLAGGGLVYILSTEGNYDKLKHLLGAHEPPWKAQAPAGSDKKAKGGKGRGRPPKSAPAPA